jgi:hypothetical protein
MIVTLNRIDNVVVVDGRALPVDLSRLDKGIAVVQWHDGRREGWIEHVQDQFAKPGEFKSNRPIASFAEFAFALDAYRAKAKQIDHPPPPSLSELKERKRTLWDRARRLEIFDGYESSALGKPHFYGGSPLDQLDMTAAIVLQGDAWDVTIWCRDVAGKWAMRRHTREQLLAAYQDGRTIIAAIHDKYAALLDQIEKAATPEALAAIALP